MVSGYDVHYSENEAFTDEDETIARTAEEISYRRENLEADTSHYVRVRSAAGTGDGRVTSGWSTHVTGMTAAATPPPPPAPVAPAAPTNLEVSDSGENFIEWTWEQVAGAAGYLAQFSTDLSFDAGRPGVQPGGRRQHDAQGGQSAGPTRTATSGCGRMSERLRSRPTVTGRKRFREAPTPRHRRFPWTPLADSQ